MLKQALRLQQLNVQKLNGELLVPPNATPQILPVLYLTHGPHVKLTVFQQTRVKKKLYIMNVTKPHGLALNPHMKTTNPSLNVKLPVNQ